MGTKEITYYEGEGQDYLDNTVAVSVERALELNAKHIIMLSLDGAGPRKAVRYLERYKTIAELPKLVAVSFSFGNVELNRSTGNLIPKAMSSKDIAELEGLGVTVLQGGLPFEEVHIPGYPDMRTKMIKETLSLFSGGLSMCVQAIVSACDAGKIEQGEDVVAFVADTAIVARASTKAFLFAPWGFVIREIICKPRDLTISKSLLWGPAKGPDLEVAKQSGV